MSQLRLYAHRRQQAQQAQLAELASQQHAQHSPPQSAARSAQRQAEHAPAPTSSVAHTGPSDGGLVPGNPLKRRLDPDLQAAAAAPLVGGSSEQLAANKPPRRRRRTTCPDEPRCDPADVPTQLLTQQQQQQQPVADSASQACNAAAPAAGEASPTKAAVAAEAGGRGGGSLGAGPPACAGSQVVDLTLSDDDARQDGDPTPANGALHAAGAGLEAQGAAAAAPPLAEPAFLSCPYGGDSLAAQLSKVRADLRALEATLEQARGRPRAGSSRAASAAGGCDTGATQPCAMCCCPSAHMPCAVTLHNAS